MRVFHEAPLAVFKDVQKVTDGDYALCHLLEKNGDYAKAFVEARVQGREIILDNSVQELKHPVDWNILDKWASALKPAWLVLPDALDDGPTTIRNAKKYILNHEIPAGTRTVGVCQGKTEQEMYRCYNSLIDIVDMIAFSFDSCRWKLPFDQGWTGCDQAMYYMQQRIKLLADFAAAGVIDTTMPHHLLGCALPQEFMAYRDYSWIYSVDTSNPVMWGIIYGEYKPGQPDHKPKWSIEGCLETSVSDSEKAAILRNIEHFKRWCN